MDNICGYGCNKLAKYPPRSGKTKWSCKETYQSCPNICASEKNGMYRKKHNNETKDKIRMKRIGTKVSEETKHKMSQTHKQLISEGKIKFSDRSGKNNSMYDKKHSEDTKKKMSIMHKGKILSDETKKKIGKFSKYNYDRGNVSKEFLNNQGQGFEPMFGNNNPSKRPEVREKIRQSKIGDNNPAKRSEVRKKISEAAKKRFRDSEFLKKFKEGCQAKPNKLELSLHDYITDYKYVGDYSHWIGGKNPDFIDFKNKKIIEVFGDYWHSEEKTGKSCIMHEEERIKHFENYGYLCLIIWEHEFQDNDKLLLKLNNFIKGG